MSLIIQIIRQLGKKWYLWVCIPFFAATLVFYLTSKGNQQYISEATVYLNLPTNKGLSITNEEYKQHEISAYIQDLIQLTNSRRSLEYIKLSILKGYLLNENDLLKTPKTAFPWTDSVHIIQRLDTLLARNEMLDLKNNLDATITIYLGDHGMTNESLAGLFDLYREGSSNYLRLKVTTNNPFASAYIGEKIIEAMLLLNKEINQGKLEADQKLFEMLVRQAKTELDKKVKNLEEYKIKHNVINLPEHTKAIVNQMVQLEVQKSELIEMMASKKEGISQIKSKLGIKNEIPVDLSKNARFIELQNMMREIDDKTDEEKIIEGLTLSKIEETSTEINLLLQEYVNDVPIDIRQARQELIQQYLSFQVELEMSRQLIPLVEAEIKRIGIYANTFAPLESNIGTLEREITTAQETFLILVNKLNLAKTVVQGTGVNELVAIDTPNIPLLPVPSKRKILIVLSAVLCFIIVVVLIAALEFLDSGIWSARDFKRVFKVEPFSVLPDIKNASKLHDDQLVDYLNVVHVQQIKSIAIKIHALVENNNREVALISSLKGEGKEELASKLAVELSKLGYQSNINMYSEFDELTKIETPETEHTASITITILPPFAVYTTWQKWLKSDMTFVWMFHAGRTPLASDLKVLDQITTSYNTLPVLMNVQADYLEDSGTSVIRKRSFIRIWIKRILTLQFKAKNMEIA